MTVFAPTDRPHSVRNRSTVFAVSLCFYDLHYLSFRGICHMTESDLFVFLYIILVIERQQTRPIHAQLKLKMIP